MHSSYINSAKWLLAERLTQIFRNRKLEIAFSRNMTRICTVWQIKKKFACIFGGKNKMKIKKEKKKLAVPFANSNCIT